MESSGNTGPFNACVAFQEASTELVIYSPLVGQIVTVAWPLYQNKRIVPAGIKSWLRNRGLHWPCFCPLISGKSVSARIVESQQGEVYVFCNEYPSSCGFFLNLTAIHHGAAVEAEYDLPTLASGRKPPMLELQMTFNLNSADDAEPGPYFEGYCGEHSSDHPEVEQLSGGEFVFDLAPNRQTTPRQLATINPRRNFHHARLVPRTASLPHHHAGHPYERIKKRPSMPSLPPSMPMLPPAASLPPPTAPLLLPALPSLSSPPLSCNIPFTFSSSSLRADSLLLYNSRRASASSSSTRSSTCSSILAPSHPNRSASTHSAPEYSINPRNESFVDWRVRALDVFDRLRVGEGVRPREWEGLVEQCTKCMEMFAPGPLKGHIPDCDGSIVL
ncbi:hypothetical protein FPV67DRAFT_1525424 [Lyophyllum atratum]|nr:hypothetical protein FPV67DRAFT_1525424 [Lyophyllum atratum]